MSMPYQTPSFEDLEPRLLLTTLYGGDTFEFQDSEDSEHIIRVTLEGDIIVEIIGADMDSENNLVLGDLPGAVTDAEGNTTYILGGIGGLDGVEAIGTVTGTGIGSDDLVINAIATSAALAGADTYGFTVYENNGVLQVSLWNLDVDDTNNSGDVEATLAASLGAVSLSDDVMSTLNDSGVDVDWGNVEAFAINSSGIAYAVSGTTLYGIDRYSGEILSENIIGGGTVTDIQAMAFDSSDNLYVIGMVGSTRHLVEIDTSDGSILSDQELYYQYDDGGVLVTENYTSDFTGMAFNSDDTLYAVFQSGGSSYLTRIDVTSGEVLDDGPTPTSTTNRIEITVAGDSDTAATQIEGICFAESITGSEILVGIDLANTDSDTGNILPQLVQINMNTGAATSLCTPGEVAEVYDLASYTEAGDSSPLLFAVDYDGSTNNLIRGSALRLSNVESIQAASFQPITNVDGANRLYFVVRDTDGVEKLYSIDVTKGNASAIQNSLELYSTSSTLNNSNENITTTSLAWDVSDDKNDVTLYAYQVNEDSDTGSLVTINPTTGAIISRQTVTFEGESVTDITGIEFISDDTAAEEDYVYAISGTNLVRITIATGLCYVVGNVSDPDDAGSDLVTGDNLAGLSWDPLMVNPFTGELGCLLATDTETDEIVILDHRIRFSTADAYAIYISQSSSDASIIISHVENLDVEDRDDYMLAYDGSVDVRVQNADPGDLITISSTSGTGEVWLGAQTEDIDPDDDEEDMIPVIAGELVGALGVRASGVDDFEDDPDYNTSAGIVMSYSLEDWYSASDALFERFLGMNLDDVQGLAIGSDGTIYVVDCDGVDETGAQIDGDQIALVNPDGTADTPVDVVDEYGNSLSNISGLAYGAYNSATGEWLTGGETLFAIYNINNPTPTTSIGDLALTDFVAVTITPGGQMYAIMDSGGAGTDYDLYKIDRDDDGNITLCTLLGTIATSAGDNITEISALEADPQTGSLYVVGLSPTDGTQTLYKLNLATVMLSGVETILVSEIGSLGAAYLTGEYVKGLAFSYDSTTGAKTLYAVLDDDGAGDGLYTINLTTGAATYIADVVADSIGSDLEGMDFLSATELIAIDNADGGRIIQINLADPTSSYLRSSGIGTDLNGYAIDSEGYAYSINSAGATDVVWVSPSDTPTLGTLDPTTGVFTAIGSLQNGSTTLEGIKAMAFRNGPSTLQVDLDALYVVDGDNNLWEIDPSTGQIVSTSYTLLDSNGDAVSIDSMDFDAEKNLYGYDQYNGRLVDIDLGALQPFGSPTGSLTVADNVSTEAGSLRPTVGAIAYDASNDQFLAADNATGTRMMSNESAAVSSESAALMVLKGLTSDSATAQNIGNIFVAGALTGKVNLSGSVDDVFYVGWLITGATKGVLDGGTVTDNCLQYPQYGSGLDFTDNFIVGGDLRNLVVACSVGTVDLVADASGVSWSYMSGYNLTVTGKIGQVWTLESYLGSLSVENVDEYLILHDDSSTTQQEIEYRTDEDHGEGVAFQEGELFRADGSFYNDSFETAQYLGTMGISTGLEDGVIQLSGSLGQDDGSETDDLDFFGISLLAGQTITLQLTSTGLSLGVYDPDGRLITTDVSDVDPASVSGQEIRITADEPGVYRIAIGGAPFDGSTSYDGPWVYSLVITDVGNVALGAVKTTNALVGNAATNSVEITYGDLGALSAGTYLLFTGWPDIVVSNGNLRTLEAASIGYLNGVGPTLYPVISVPNGDVGLLLATGTGETETLEIWTDDAIGGNFQLIDAAADFWGQLLANGGLGVLLAGSMSETNLVGFPPVIQLNMDGVGDDGIIDLIDVEGDLGNGTVGGVQIDCGLNGDVRYIRVGGAIYQDTYFGTGDYSGVTLDPGQSATIQDDSGATITLTPLHMTTHYFTGDAIDPQTLLAADTEDLPYLTYRTYGIRGSGGSVIVEVTSTGGLVVSADSNGVSAPVAIGQITVLGQGRELVADGDGYRLEDQVSPFYNLDLRVGIVGSTVIDVFEIIGGNFTSIRNYTGGEIVNVIADSIGTLYAYGSVGIAKSTFGVAVNPRRDLVSTYDFIPAGYPFLQQHIGIVVNGNVDAIRSCSAIGNVMVNGQIDSVIANYGQSVDITDANFDGIAAPIFATGDICSVNIGEGIAPSGSGEFAYAGLFSLGEIRYVFNSSANANIRGAVVGEQGVRNITLTNGSIINADILAAELDSALEYTGGTLTGDVTKITISGNGGIIGALIAGINVGNIAVNNGFGIFNCYIRSIDSGSIGNITVDGFGVRLVEFDGGTDMGNIIATGQGALASTLDYSATVRYSETGDDWLPGTNQRLSALNDIHQFLGTSAADPMDRLGMLEDIYAHGNGDLGVVKGYRITTNRGTTSDSGGTSFDFANSIAGFLTYAIHASDTATNSIDNVEITTGKLGYFNPAQDVNDLDMTVAGLISNMIIRGSLLGTSTIAIVGPNGNLNKLTIYGEMEGNVTVEGIAGTITIYGNMTGNITIDPTLAVQTALSRLTIYGSYTGDLDVDGNVGTIDVRGDLGTAGDSLLINGNLGTLSVGEKNAPGSDMALDLNVQGSVTNMRIYGAMSGDAWIGENLRTLTVVNPGIDIDGNLTVMGTLTKATITGGSWASDMTVGDNIGTVQIIGVGANLKTGASITSLLGDINLVWIKGGDLEGTVSAPNGTINQIRVTGSDLGKNSLIEAGQLNTLRLDGSILSGARVVIDGELRTLDVRGSIQAGSTISVGSIRTLTVQGNLAGDFSLGYSSRTTTIRVGGTLGSDGSVFKADTDVKLYVGNIADGATLWVTSNLIYLRSGAINGNVIVDGSITTLQATSLTSGVIVSGMDMNNIRITGAVSNSLIQAGINRGDDGDFATDDENGSQISRMGQIKRIQVGSATLSIIAAGGNIVTAYVQGALTDSSISSGMVLAGGQIQNVLDGTNTMTVVADLNNLRGNAGDAVTLLWGNFKTATVRGAMTGSALTAGVDPGANGVFEDTDVVTTSETGGNSSFSRITANGADGTSIILADAGLGRARTGGAATEGNITYDVLTDANVLDGAAIEALQGTAQAGASVTFAGITVTIIGAGQVQVRHSGASGADIDTLVILGTNSSTRITITGGGSIGRILTADDTVVGTLTYDGTLLGNGNGLWLDAGTIRTFSLGTLGAAVRGGRIGGDVTNLTLGTQGSGELRVGGSVNTLRITNGDDSLLNELGNITLSETLINAIAVGTGTDQTWVFNGDGTSGDNQIQLWNINDDQSGGNPSSAAYVLSYLNGAISGALVVTAMDYDFAGGDLLAVVEAWSLSPTVDLGAIANESLSLAGLAVLANGNTYSIETADMTELTWDMGVDVGTIVATAIDSNGNKFIVNDAGELWYFKKDEVTAGQVGVDVLNVGGTAILNIAAMDIDSDGTLYFVGELDGSGEMSLFTLDVSDPESATAEATTVGALDGGGFTDSIKAMCFTQDESVIYAVRETAGTDILCQITKEAPVTVTNVTGATLGSGEIQVVNSGGANYTTDICGIDIDAAGNILALDKGAGATDGWIIRINIVDPGLSWNVGDNETILADATSFASTTNGEFYTVNSSGANDRFLYSIGRDRLVEIDSSTGAREVVGYLKDIYGNYYYSDVYTIAGNDSNELYAILKDGDGMGGALTHDDDGNYLAVISTTASSGNVRVSSPTSSVQPPVQLDYEDSGAIITNEFTAMAVNADDTIYAIYRNGGQDFIVNIETDGDVNFGAHAIDQLVQADGSDTQIVGMGFDSLGNLVAYDLFGGGGLINLSNPLNHELNAASVADSQLVTATDVLNPNIDAYAIGRSLTTGAEIDGYMAYAYDYDNTVGGLFYASPGAAATLGIIDTGASLGAFTQLMALASQADGTALTSEVLDISFVDADNVYVITADGNLYRYNENGVLLADLGPVQDAATLESLSLTTFDYDSNEGATIAIDGKYNQLVTLNTDMADVTSVGTLDYSDFKDLTITAGGVMYALRENSVTSEFELYRVARDADGEILGTLMVEDEDENNPLAGIDSINSIETDSSSGVVYFIGTTGTQQTLFTVTSAGVITEVADLSLLGSEFTYEVKAMCFSGDTMYIVANDGAGDTLYRVDTTTGTVTEIGDPNGTFGQIQVGGVDMEIKGIDAGSDGSIIAIATTGAGTARIIRIDTVDPGNSVNLTAAGTIPDDYLGFTFDANNRFFIIDPTAANDQIVQSNAATATARMESGSVDAADVTDLSQDGSNPGNFYTFSKSFGTYGAFAELTGTKQDEQFGVTLDSVNRLYLGDGYAGRIVATGNTFRSVTVTGDFEGTLYTAGQIRRYYQTGGDFSGTLFAQSGLGSITIRGDLLEGGLLSTPGAISSVRVTGAMDGGLSAGQSNRLTFGSAGATADIRVFGSAGRVQVSNEVAGSMEFGSVSYLRAESLDKIDYPDGSTTYADIQIHGDAGTIQITDGTDTGTYLKVDGSVSRLAIGGVHKGTIAIDKGATNVQFATITNAFVVIGQNVRTLRVNENVSYSVLSIGTTIGADGIYNTSDDRITGGILTNGVIRGNFTNSALVAGVLPNLSYGSGLPAEMWYYTGDDDAANLEDIDSAEVGGVLPSAILRLTFYDQTGTEAAGTASAVASESLGQITRRRLWDTLYTREYNNPINPPAIEWSLVQKVSDSEAVIYFTEEINTASLILSVDANNDGDLDDLTDIRGTITILDEDSEKYIDDVTLTYTKVTGEDGQVYGVLHITKNGFLEAEYDAITGDYLGPNISIVLSGSMTSTAITGLSGLRSVRQDLAEFSTPMMGTILDGNNDSAEGEDAEVYFGVCDIGDLITEYVWWYGCAPTSAGIIMAYYDNINNEEFGELIEGKEGEADYVEHVHEAIASSGDGTYNSGSGPLVTDTPATPGTGYIGDYGLYVTPGTDYLDSDDYGDATPIPDLSDPEISNVVGAPHDSDCLADFMKTGWSVEGLTMGGSWPVNIGVGMTDYVEWVNQTRGSNYGSQYSHLDYDTGEFNLGVLAGEIANGRPVLVLVDSSGNGVMDHAMVAIGYNFITQQYAFYDTWGDGVVWADFDEMEAGRLFGVESGYTFQITDAA